MGAAAPQARPAPGGLYRAAAAALAMSACAPDPPPRLRGAPAPVASASPLPRCPPFKRFPAWTETEARRRLASGVVVRGTFASAVVHEYRLDLRRDTATRLIVDQAGVDVALRVEPPDGRIEDIQEIDRAPGRRGTEVVPLVASRDGPYRVLVRPLGWRCASEGYTLRVDTPRPATARDRRWARASADLAEAEQLLRSADQADAEPSGLQRDRRARAAERLDALTQEWAELGLPSEEAYSLRRRAAVWVDEGDWAKAQRALERASTVARVVSPEQAGRALLELGEVQRRGSRREEAKRSFDAALALALGWAPPPTLGAQDLKRRIGVPAGCGDGVASAAADPLLAAAVVQRFSVMQTHTGAPDRAVELARLALEIWRDEERPDQLGDAWPMLCMAYTFLGRSRDAQESAECGLQVALAIGDQRGQIEAYLQLGWLRYLDRRPSEALEQYARGLDLATRLGLDEPRGALLDRRGSALKRLGRLSPARSAYKEALTLWEKRGDKRFQAHTIANLAAIDALSDWEKAGAGFERAIELFKESEEKDNHAHVIVQRARLALDRTDEPVERIVEDIQSAISLLEEGRDELRGNERAHYLAARHQFYELKVEALMRQGGAERDPAARERAFQAAFEAAESGRARALAEDLGGRRDKDFPLREVQKLLDDETLLVAYALGERRSFVWLVGHDSFRAAEVRARELPLKRDQIEKLVNDWRRLLGLRRPSVVERAKRDELAAALGDILFGPLERLGGKRLLIVGDVALQSIPFAALAVRSATRPGRVLVIDEHEITSAPSARVVGQLRARARAFAPERRPVAVFADPVFDAEDPRLAGRAKRKGDEMSPALELALDDFRLASPLRLAGTHAEAENIRRLAPGARVTEGFDVNLARFRQTAERRQLGKYRCLHFATHGLLNERNPQLSGLLLSRYTPDGAPADGFLRAHDVAGLFLQADLVTLSACQTAIGEALRGEGLLGLKQAFLKAGATRVLLSLWPVEDAATADLMTRFYEKHLTNGLRPSAALRETQRELRRKGVLPAHWAAFIVEGDW